MNFSYDLIKSKSKLKEVIVREIYRFYPNESQKFLLAQTFGCVRFVWNNYTSIFNSKDLSMYKTIKELKIEHPFLKEVPYNALEQKLQDFNQLKSQFFNKKRKKQIGRPKFKSKRDSVQSFRLSSNGFSIKNGNLYLGKRIGKISIRGSSKLEDLSNVTSVTISKKSTGKYFVSVCYKSFKKEKVKTGKSIGIDLGLTHFIIDSQGDKVENPRFLKQGLDKLKKAQQSLSRKIKGSKRREKARIKVSKLHEKISNQRNHFLHQVSNELIEKFDKIYVEDLNVQGMIKNKKLSRSISDVSWSKFVSMLEYKADWYGKSVYKINRFFASSKTCSECGFQKEKMDLSVREWSCPDCGSHHDRDVNAAKNVLQRGIFETSLKKIDSP